MKVNDLTSSLERIKLSKIEEEQIWSNISEQRTSKVVSQIVRKSRIRIAFSTCLAVFVAIIIIFGANSENVRASFVNLSTDLFKLIAHEDNYDTQNIGTSGLKEPLVMIKDDITVTINQCIASDHDFIIDYSIKADGVREKVLPQGLNQREWRVGFEVFNGYKEVTETLFEKFITGSSTNSASYPNATKDNNTVEFFERFEGSDFLYKGKALKIKIYIGNEHYKRINFTFDIQFSELYQDKIIPINETVYFNKLDYITITEVVSSFSKTYFKANGILTEPMYLNVLGSSSEKNPIKQKIIKPVFGKDTLPESGNFNFIRYIGRDDNNKKENYTMQIFDSKKKLIKEITIHFNK